MLLKHGEIFVLLRPHLCKQNFQLFFSVQINYQYNISEDALFKFAQQTFNIIERALLCVNSMNIKFYGFWTKECNKIKIFVTLAKSLSFTF